MWLDDIDTIMMVLISRTYAWKRLFERILGNCLDIRIGYGPSYDILKDVEIGDIEITLVTE